MANFFLLISRPCLFSRASGPPNNSCPKFTPRIVGIPVYASLGGRFGYFFSARGRGRGSSRRREEGGGRFAIENPRRGGVLLGGVGVEAGSLQGIWVWMWGGAKYFFGAEMPTKKCCSLS